MLVRQLQVFRCAWCFHDPWARSPSSRPWRHPSDAELQAVPRHQGPLMPSRPPAPDHGPSAPLRQPSLSQRTLRVTSWASYVLAGKPATGTNFGASFDRSHLRLSPRCDRLVYISASGRYIPVRRCLQHPGWAMTSPD